MDVFEGAVVYRFASAERMPDIGKHLCSRWAYINLFRREPKAPHEISRIGQRGCACGEPRHRYSNDIFSRQLQLIERARDHKRGLRRIESAGNSDHDPLEMCRFKPFGQPLDLNVVDLVTAFVTSERIGGNIRKSLDITPEPYLVFCKFEMDRYNSHLFEFMTVCSNAIAEARHSHSFLPKAIEIQIRGC